MYVALIFFCYINNGNTVPTTTVLFSPWGTPQHSPKQQNKTKTKINRQQQEKPCASCDVSLFLTCFARFCLTLLMWVDLLGVSKEMTDVEYKSETLTLLSDRSHGDGGKKFASLYAWNSSKWRKENDPSDYGWAKWQNSELLLRIH